MYKVFILNGGGQYRDMFINRGWEVVDNPKDADAIQFCGGHDVTPSIYDNPQHPKTFNNPKRDKEEQEIFIEFSEQKPMMGICRGAQFLWVMNGGRMYQHVEGHAIHGTHDAIDLETQDIRAVTSTHHQMMMETRETVASAKLLCIATHCNHKEWMEPEGQMMVNQGDFIDIESAFFGKTMSLCFQPHPEFGPGDCQDYYFELIDRYITPYIYEG